MDYIVKDILSGELIPVLLGTSPEAMETARRMYRKYGVVSHVFCDRVPLSMRLTLCAKYHRIPHSTGERLMLTALEDYAAQMGNADVIPYLIPCTETYANLIWNHREVLESRYVIADLREMRRVWFGEEESVPSARQEGVDPS